MISGKKIIEPVCEEIPEIKVDDLIKIFEFKSDLMVLHSSMVMDSESQS